MAEAAVAVKSPRKRRYVERPDMRAKLLDAAEALIREDGYGAATARRIADSVGVKHQAVFYYFGSQDELLVAVFNRVSKSRRERLHGAMNAENPIRALWEFHRDPDVTRFTLEFMALANHNESIRAEIARSAQEFRELETEVIGRYLEARGIEPRLSPQYVAMLTNAMARLLVQEANLGIFSGHAEVEAIVAASMAAFEKDGMTGAGDAPWVEALNSLENPANR